MRREVFAQVPPKVVYHLTELGRELNLALEPLGDWGERHQQAIATARGAEPGPGASRAGS